MKRPDILNFSTGLATDELDFTTWETNTTITIRARDIHGVMDQPVSQEFPTDSGPVSTIFWNDTSILVRRSRTDILADIAAIAPETNLGTVFIQDQKTLGTDGGTFTSGAWRTRDLTTLVLDPESLASLAANQVTLVAGTWRINSSAPAFRVNGHQARLRNITAGTTTTLGTSESSGTGGSTTNRSTIIGAFVIAVSTIFEIQHQCATTRATDGFGSAASFATEIYTDVIFTRIGD